MYSTESSSFDKYEIELEQNRFMTKVFMWMFMGLVVTGLVAMFTASNEYFVYQLLVSKAYYVVIIAELFVGFTFIKKVRDMSVGMAISTFFLYSALTGLTFSLLFVIYTASSIASTFFITAAMFGTMALYGLVTKKDLTSWGSILFMGLTGLIVTGVINMFLQSSAVYITTSIIGVFIFSGLTAYDAQKIKECNIIGNEGTDEDFKEAIYGAFILYLDFINLFLKLLGKKK